jgi:hypothetical protein
MVMSRGILISSKALWYNAGVMASRRRKAKSRGKDPFAVALGRRGGKARVARMTPEQLREAMRKASLARWARVKAEKNS